MVVSVFIEPHERHEAILAWAGALTPAQMDEIENAPNGALVRLHVNREAKSSSVLIIPEG